MSRLRQRNGDDYPDAARKHLEDAKVLLAGSRPDGAAYLVGVRRRVRVEDRGSIGNRPVVS